jgi:hypothetical protein
VYEYETELDFNDVLHAFESSFMMDDDINLLETDLPITVQSLNKRSPWYEATLRHAEMVDKFATGKYAAEMFPAYVRTLRRNKEAISTSDFSQLTANVLYWALLPLYAAEDNQWEKLVSIRDTIQDFRNVQLTRIEGGDQPFPLVPELSNYPMVTMVSSDKTYKVNKYGEIVSISWEATLNDYLNMFSKWPQWLAMGARATENSIITQLLAVAAGPNPLLFSTNGSTNGGVTNQVNSATNGILNEANLIAAYTAMNNQFNAAGNPMMVKPKYLVVPPALLYTAQKLLSATVLIPGQLPTTGTAGQNVMISGVNAVGQLGLEIVENRWLAKVDTSGNANVTWYLLAEPGATAAMEVGFLTGQRSPQVFQKISGQQTSGGGATDPMQGDFERDAMAWKVRHIFGGLALEPRYAYAMRGA